MFLKDLSIVKKRWQTERTDREAGERLSDRLSDLPNFVLLHVMKFMNAKQAVQTCVLSKRWMDLWKNLTSLTLHSSDFKKRSFFTKFVSSIISCRDGSISVHKFDLKHDGFIEPKILNDIMTYATSHAVEQFSIDVHLNRNLDYGLLVPLSYCSSLTYLNLNFSSWDDNFNKIKLPNSLHLPALEKLFLMNVTFSASGDGFSNPFSTCDMLNTLVIQRCYLQNDAKGLCISNSKISRISIMSFSDWGNLGYKTILLTPNLSFLTIRGHPLLELSACNNLLFLEEVNIDVYSPPENNSLFLMAWLPLIAHVKKISLSQDTLRVLNDLLSSGSLLRTQPPSFLRLKSLQLEIQPSYNISDEEQSRVVEYLLKNTPLTNVDIKKKVENDIHA